MLETFEKQKQTIVSLCSVMSVSGYETRATEEIERLFGKSFDRIECDAVGNHFLWKCSGREGAPKILIDTHLDEIGMLVREILGASFGSCRSADSLRRCCKPPT